MRNPLRILLIGLIGCILAFAICYVAGTARARNLLQQPRPELAWLKEEFHLSDAEFARISALHQAYLPGCAERCRLIEEQNERLDRLMAGNTNVTPEIEEVMALRARLRADCQAAMLRHFLEVSRTMPAEQGRRYLAWVKQQTILESETMEQQHRAGHHHH